MRDKVAQTQNVNALTGLGNIDGAGCLVLNNQDQVNSYYRNGPLVLTSKGVAGITAGRGDYRISELVTNQNLAFDIPFRLTIDNAKLGPGAEYTFCRMMDSNCVKLRHAEYGKGFKLNSSQYNALLNSIVKDMFKSTHHVLGLRENKNGSITDRYFVLDYFERNYDLTQRYITSLYRRCEEPGLDYMELNLRKLFRRKSELIIDGILTENELAKRIYRDSQEGPNKYQTMVERSYLMATTEAERICIGALERPTNSKIMVGWAYLMAVTSAIISGEDAIISRLNNIVEKMNMARYRDDTFIEVYNRYK